MLAFTNKRVFNCFTFVPYDIDICEVNTLLCDGGLLVGTPIFPLAHCLYVVIIVRASVLVMVLPYSVIMKFFLCSMSRSLQGIGTVNLAIVMLCMARRHKNRRYVTSRYSCKWSFVVESV